MSDWTQLSPALGETISAAFANIRSNWTALANAWSGDHRALTSDGTSSTVHEKVTLPEITSVPSAIENTGFVYTKEDSDTNKTELFFEDEDGSEVQLTKRGYGKGSYNASCVYRYNASDGARDAAAQIRSSVNIDDTSLVLSTALIDPTFQVNFITPMSTTDYNVMVTAVGLTSSITYAVGDIEKYKTHVKFKFQGMSRYIFSGHTVWVSEQYTIADNINFTVIEV